MKKPRHKCLWPWVDPPPPTSNALPFLPPRETFLRILSKLTLLDEPLPVEMRKKHVGCISSILQVAIDHGAWDPPSLPDFPDSWVQPE